MNLGESGASDLLFSMTPHQARIPVDRPSLESAKIWIVQFSCGLLPRS